MGRADNVPIETPSSKALAELYGIRMDLQLVVELCDKLLSYYQNIRGVDTLVLEAVATAAVVRYGRCFLSGVTQRRDLYTRLSPLFSPDQAKQHEYLLDYRSKFVAHSVNVFEDNRVAVSIPVPPPADWVPTALNYHHGRPGGLGPGDVRILRDLAGWADLEVEKLMKVQEQLVLVELRSIPATELAAREVVTPVLPRRRDVKKPR